MDSLLHKFESFQASMAHFPIAVYVFIGCFVEELVSPIPSPLVLTSAGFLVDSQNKGILYLFIAALFGTLGKMLATMIYFWAGLKGEEFFDKKIVRVLGLKKLDVEKYGNFFEESKKGIILFMLMRIVPIFPSAPISLVAGMIQMETRKFVILSTIGIYIRNLLLLAFGYFSYENMDYVLGVITNLESKLGEVLILVVMLGFAVYAYKNKDRVEDLVLKRIRKE